MNRNRKKAVAASVAVGMTMVMGCQPGSGSEYRYFQRRDRICKCSGRRNSTGDHSFRLAEKFCFCRRLK